MNHLILVIADLVALGVLAFGLYLPRHHRRDLVTAFVAVNIGVLVVSTLLADAAVGAGLGLGLFGVLSIIRLRSTELDQQEIGYYFSALAIGLVSGLAVGSLWLTLGCLTLVVVAMAVVDSPRFTRRSHRQVIVLDRVVTDPAALVAHLEGRLNASVSSARVLRTSFVDESMTVDVRYRTSPSGLATHTAATSTIADRGTAGPTQAGLPTPAADPTGRVATTSTTVPVFDMRATAVVTEATR